jgi:hypothetical protein
MRSLEAISGLGERGKVSLMLLLGCILLLASPLRAQSLSPPPPAAEENAPSKLPQEALNQLLAPIALYPDALVALILPASTVPSDLVLAARYIASSGDPAQVANQSWDDSVKSLARYPDIVKWMDQNLEWTTQVGDAFLNQPADVMNTIQQLRARAIAAGNLVDSPQQRIVREESCVRIVPAEPDAIYVPQYDPELVYVQPEPAIAFGVGFALGPWLNFDCDWPRHKVYVGDWNPEWKRDWDPGWRRNWKRKGGDTIDVVNITSESVRVWEASPKIRRQHWQRQRYNAQGFDGNARVKRGNANDAGQRFAAVARPSRQDFNGRTGDGDRRALRRSDPDVSNLARNLPGEMRKPSSRAPKVDPQTGQTERLRRGNGAQKWKGPEQGRGVNGDRSNATAKKQSLSAREKTWQGDNHQARKLRADSSSVKTNRSSNEDQSRRNFKKARSESFHSESTKVNKHSRANRIERSKGGSRDAAASNSKPNKSKHEGAGGKKGGKGQKSGKKEKKGKD